MEQSSHQPAEESELKKLADDMDQANVMIIGDEEDPALLMHPEVHKGRLIGDELVRWELPRKPSFKRVGMGLLEATNVTQAPRTAWDYLKRLFIGAPLATAQSEHERLSKFKALAVLSSDAISSVAYATDAILVALISAGVGSRNLWMILPISVAIVGLLTIVVISYRQTIPAYPNGGGSYIVAKDNLGTLPGLIAAASLLIDYILTVSVSISSGVLTLASYFAPLSPYAVLIDVVLVIIVTIVNLRGVRESGTIFALPTYLFISSALLLIAIGLIKSFGIEHHPLIGQFDYIRATQPLTLFLVLKAFAAGCSAMTGVEAISNGVPAFKKPETRNAVATLTWMAVILGTLFIGITLLATSYHIEVNVGDNPTVVAQIAARVFTGPLSFMNPVFILATLLILTLAANTSYSDFPRLASLLARDNFLPHQFAFRGDRLAFSIGIVFLALLAGVLIVVFNGDPTQLINLYAVGVFMSFTLSQSGMVRHWWKLRHEHQGWLRSLLINGLGALTTLTVALIISITKFLEGAWIVVILIPLLVLMFTAISHHYAYVEQRRTASLPLHAKDIHHRFIVPVSDLDVPAKHALAYARSVTPTVIAVHVAVDGKKASALEAAWTNWQEGLSQDERIVLDIIQPSHRSLIRSLLDYFDKIQQQYFQEVLTVILPEVAHSSSLSRLLHNRTISALKAALYFHPNIVVTNVSQERKAGDIPIRPKDIKHRFIVPIARLDQVSLQSLAYAHSISARVVAVHVAMDAHDVHTVHEAWERLRKQLYIEEGTQLVVIESPYRSLARPLLAYIDTMRDLHPKDTLTIIFPEFVVAHWWEHLLHNQTALRLKAALLARPSIVVTSVPQHLGKKSNENP